MVLAACSDGATGLSAVAERGLDRAGFHLGTAQTVEIHVATIPLEAYLAYFADHRFPGLDDAEGEITVVAVHLVDPEAVIANPPTNPWIGGEDGPAPSTPGQARDLAVTTFISEALGIDALTIDRWEDIAVLLERAASDVEVTRHQFDPEA